MAFYDLLDAATLPSREFTGDGHLMSDSPPKPGSPHERTMSFLKSNFLQVVCRVRETVVESAQALHDVLSTKPPVF